MSQILSVLEKFGVSSADAAFTAPGNLDTVITAVEGAASNIITYLLGLAGLIVTVFAVNFIIRYVSGLLKMRG